MVAADSPLSDRAFKKLFGSPEHRAIPLSFINSVFSEAQLPPAAALHIQNPHRLPAFSEQIFTELDILYKDETGRHIQLEMQAEVHRALEQRMHLNVSELFAGQSKRGRGFETFLPVVSLWLLKESLWDDEPWFHDISFNSQGTHLEGRPYMRMITVELDKWEHSASGAAARDGLEIGRLGLFDKWLVFLTRAESKDGAELAKRLGDPIFKEAIQLMKGFTLAEELRYAYSRWRHARLLRHTLLADAREEGKMTGKLEGKIESAQQLKVLGVPFETIEKATGLDRKQIEGL
jgi:predicted transposase/invertase (TIGR01784 family)